MIKTTFFLPVSVRLDVDPNDASRSRWLPQCYSYENHDSTRNTSNADRELSSFLRHVEQVQQREGQEAADQHAAEQYLQAEQAHHAALHEEQQEQEHQNRHAAQQADEQESEQEDEQEEQFHNLRTITEQLRDLLDVLARRNELVILHTTTRRNSARTMQRLLELGRTRTDLHYNAKPLVQDRTTHA